ncbi:hypothetical protein TNCV_3659731 [Trichonephila clavipes]|nr:hypothetical protein TNCV_3659731 [Trichonephila clavipes]
MTQLLCSNEFDGVQFLNEPLAKRNKAERGLRKRVTKQNKILTATGDLKVNSVGITALPQSEFQCVL